MTLLYFQTNVFAGWAILQSLVPSLAIPYANLSSLAEAATTSLSMSIIQDDSTIVAPPISITRSHQLSLSRAVIEDFEPLQLLGRMYPLSALTGCFAPFGGVNRYHARATRLMACPHPFAIAYNLSTPRARVNPSNISFITVIFARHHIL
ncbi:uncharacterized protein ARMOST_02192 [Armillaria ostoyae]|uniref:Uncharacterized protein n=1 Tax=Armillaria ostoyae TaxID=47428 RepID=A0A284QR30_ARMOS|nr:uncharacterized protein ARMOST_02192 [Armillaria ostoyae]